MPVGVSPQGAPQSAEGAAGVASGQSQAQVDLWLAYSFALGFQIARQSMVVSDPANAYAAASVKSGGNVTGNEFALAVTLMPNQSDLTALLQTSQQILSSLQQLILLFGGGVLSDQSSFAPNLPQIE